MLAPGGEISPKYLRTLRQTLRDIILPEVLSAAGRNALTLCDFILVRMIAALQELPEIHAAHQGDYQTLLNDAARLTGSPAADRAEPAWVLAKALQDELPALFAKLAAYDFETPPPRPSPADAGEGAEKPSPACGGGLGGGAEADDTRRLLAEIAEADASFRRDYEAAYKRADSATEPPLQVLLVNVEAVQSYLDRRFPGDRIRLLTCHQIPGGRSKLTVLLSVEPNATLPDEMVIRIDGPGSAINTTVLDEFPVLDVMYKSGIAAPEPLWVEAEPEHLGAPFLVMRRMPGAAAGDLWGAEKVAPAIGLALAEALANVHGANIAAIWPTAPQAARDAVLGMIDTFESGWRAGDSTPSLAMELAYGWLRRHLSCIDGPTVAVHGDAHFANLLALDDRLVCLLDWEFTHPGHPADDLAYCRSYVETIMPWGDFIRHYRDHGGPAVSEAQLQFFAVWGYLRNITFGANMLRDFAAGKVRGIQNLAIALNTRAKLEALLARIVAAAMARDADAQN